MSMFQLTVTDRDEAAKCVSVNDPHIETFDGTWVHLTQMSLLCGCVYWLWLYVVRDYVNCIFNVYQTSGQSAGAVSINMTGKKMCVCVWHFCVSVYTYISFICQ